MKDQIFGKFIILSTTLKTYVLTCSVKKQVLETTFKYRLCDSIVKR